jgi:hypothetical protein
MNTASDIRTARAFRAQAVYFRRIGSVGIADALIEAADALSPAGNDAPFHEPLDDEAMAE